MDFANSLVVNPKWAVLTLLGAGVAARRPLSDALMMLQVLCLGHRDRLWVVAVLQVLV